MTDMRKWVVAGVLIVGLLVVARAPEAFGEGSMVDINRASAAELSELNGIGAVKAQAIVAYRDKNGPFASVDDLRQVSGIGEKLLQRLRPQVTVGGADGKAPAAAAALPAGKQ